MKTSVALVVVLAITVLLSVAGAQEVTTIRVADTAVRIPAPEGFFRYDGKHPEVDKIAIRLVGSNRLLAAYSSQEDLKRALNGRYPKLERHFSVQTDPKLEAVAFDSELFGLLKQRMRQDFAAADGFEKYRDTIKEVEADGSAA